MTIPSDYTLTWQPAKSKGKIVVSVARDDDPIYVDELNIQNAKQREALRTKLIGLNCDAGLVELDLLRLATEALPKEKSAAANGKPDPLALMDQAVVADAVEKLSNCDSLLELAYSDASQIGVVGEERTILTLYLAGVSRLLAKPMSVIVQGSSSSGKSFSVEAAAELFPPEEKVVAQQMTPQSLYYLPPGSLQHKFVVCGERSRIEDDSTAEATRALREMISSGVLRKLIPVKGADGRMTTECIESEGPIAFVESTTLGQIFDEDRNRCVLIHTDETEKQTRRILFALAGRRNKQSAECIERQHAIQRLLKPQTVIVPYASKLAEALPAEKVECRRAFGHLLTCIRASALLNQRQRSIDEGCLVANESDYATAFTLLSKPMTEALGRGVSDVASEFWLWLATHYGSGETFCVQDLLNREDNPKGKDRSYSIVNELASVNCLKIVPMQGTKTRYYRLDRSPDYAGSPLPDPQALFSEGAFSIGMSELPRDIA
jgi:hypothetical protein